MSAMRRIALIAMTLAALPPPAARADHTDPYPPRDARWIRFEATPCALACPYWLDVANADVDGDGDPELYVDHCAAPFPPGSWDDVVVTAPPGADLLQFAAYPEFDWDTFVCGPGGESYATRSDLAHAEPCDNWIEQNSTIPFGCSESYQIRVDPGQRLILRAYNWVDPLPLHAWYAFVDLDL